MKFSDEGIIISQKKYGENSLIVKVFSSNHGIYKAFVKSVKSAKNKTIFQIGNLISFEYNSRNEENLGQFLRVDLVKSFCSKIIFDKLRLDCVSSLFSIIDTVFLERENHEELFGKICEFLQEINSSQNQNRDFLAKYVKIELNILKTLGYEIDLSSCVATQSTSNLTFVSPKSARAVCLEAGEPYKNKLLKLPNFLTNSTAKIANDDIKDGLFLSGYFLEKFIFEGCEEKIATRKKLCHFQP